MARDPFRYFRVEARELLDGLNQGLLALEREGASEAALALLLRQAHTLKGAARVVKHLGLADLAHALEGVLEPLRAAPGPLPSGLAVTVSGQLKAMAVHLGALEQDQAPAPAAKPATGAPQSLREAPRLDTVRLEVAELDSVLDGLRESLGRLAVLKRQTGAVAGFDQTAAATLDQAERELMQAHDKAARLRLLPASLLFDFLERVARDAAAATGRPLRFRGVGAEQRLDAALLAGLQEALQHVVRNAVVHGLEDGPERAAAGKAPEGEICVELRRQRAQLCLICRDDGRGIDTVKLRRAALAKGLLPANAPESLEMEAAIGLLLNGGGLSTAGELTELSGRGLGLEVLRASVEALRGQVQLRSERGRGTELELRMPASLTSYDALAVQAGALPLLIPFQAVRQALRLDARHIARAPGGDSLLWQGEALPYLRLASLYGQAGAGTPASAVIIHGTSGSVALGVERVLGVREAIVLPLPEWTPAAAGIAGACLDALGEPCAVLDPDGLVALVQARAGAGTEEAASERLPLLVVDDSMTTRMLEQSILETAGYRVEVAVSGEEGLLKLSQQRFGLILVDVEMPGMDGFEFLERLRADAALRDIPAIMVTSRDAPQDRRRGQLAGARDYVIKGEFDQPRLLARIQELLA